jgi:hypothetical protein
MAAAEDNDSISPPFTGFDTPERFKCPITHRKFKVPFRTPEGKVYEKEAIEAMLLLNPTDPQT